MVIIVAPKEISFDEVSEKWNYYKLDDGSILKLKIVLIKVIDEGNDDKENPVYGLQSAPVIGVSPSKDLFKNESITPIEDIEFKITNEEWNEYKLENGSTLMLKPSVAQINRTGKLDQRGVPSYNIQTQPLIKMKKD